MLRAKRWQALLGFPDNWARLVISSVRRRPRASRLLRTRSRASLDHRKLLRFFGPLGRLIQPNSGDWVLTGRHRRESKIPSTYTFPREGKIYRAIHVIYLSRLSLLLVTDVSNERS